MDSCQARLLHAYPKITFKDGSTVWLEAACQTPAEPGQQTCRHCGFFQRPLHGLISEKPPDHTHTYLSGWYEKKVVAVGPLTIRDVIFLKGAHEAATKGAPLPPYCHPKQLAPTSSKAMPPKLATKPPSAAQPPPPPSSPASGSSVKVKKSATLTPETEVKVVGKAPRARVKGARKRSPVARISDASPPMVSLQADFRLAPEKKDVLASSLHVFVPESIESADEPLEIGEVEYVKLEPLKVEATLDSVTEYINPGSPQEKFAYTPQMGLVRL